MPFVTLDAVYDQPTEVHHHQLKDLVQSVSQHLLYCVHDRNTVKFDTQNKKGCIIQTLNFLPYCMAAGSGYIAAGGQGGLLDVRSLDQNRLLFSGSIGGAVNNSLRIVETPVGVMLYVCNNDKTIKIFDVRFMEAVDKIEFPHRVNYAVADRDAEMLLSVGDSSIIYLHQSTEEGYRRQATFKGYADGGMCCAWDPTGIRLAAAGEDGTLCIFDRRHGRKIFQTKNSRPCRNVQFSSGPMDLLAYAEDAGAVHLLDWRNMSTRQRLQIYDGDEATISGLNFSPDGRRLFVGTTSNGILGFSVDGIGRRRFSDGCFL